MSKRSKPPTANGGSSDEAAPPSSRGSKRQLLKVHRSAPLKAESNPKVQEVAHAPLELPVPRRAILVSQGPFEQFEPHSASVDISDLLNRTSSFVRRHTCLSKEQADAIALWVVFAHAHHLAQFSPILGIVSPTMRCGKTTLLRSLGLLVPRAVSTSNVSPAGVFRTVDKYEPTLLIDEADTFFKSYEDMRNVLNSGHTRATACVIRCEGEKREPKKFSTFCAKAVAKIGDLPDTLSDRSIIIRLSRKLPSEKIEPFGAAAMKEARLLRAMAARWVIDSEEKLHE